MQEVRDQILIKTTKMLYSYRKHCAAHIDAGQVCAACHATSAVVSTLIHRLDAF